MDGVVAAAPAQVVSPANPAEAEYAWRAQDTATVGLLRAEFQVTYPDGGVETFAHTSDGSALLVSIRPSLDGGAAEVVRHIIGETAYEPLSLTDDAGAALDLTGAAVAALVSVGGAVVEHPLTIIDAMLGEAWPAWGDLGLPPGSYPVRLRLTWPDGAVDISDTPFTLQVTA